MRCLVCRRQCVVQTAQKKLDKSASTADDDKKDLSVFIEELTVMGEPKRCHSRRFVRAKTFLW